MYYVILCELLSSVDINYFTSNFLYFSVLFCTAVALYGVKL